MNEEQWEYCSLHLDSYKKHTQGLFEAKSVGYSYDCWTVYYGPTGALRQTLATIDNVLSFDPFAKALGLLGSNGWELVSVQHGNLETAAFSSRSTSEDLRYFHETLCWMNKIAYFKRKVLPGRAVTEPQLAL